MIRCSKILLFFTAAVLLAWSLPWFYRFLTDRPDHAPFTLYSCVTGGFASIDYSEKDGIRYRDASGKLYADKEFDSILPMFYYRQLMADGRLPDSLCGVKITPQMIGMNNFIFRHSPSERNKVAPTLYPLLEAMSGRVDLKMPDDVFRLTADRIEFIDMATNAVDETKSESFTRTMKVKGFEFPARCVRGNPSTKKDYDEGYFLIDDAGTLFHLKQLRGRPYVRRIDLPEGADIREIFVTEFASRRTYALLSDATQRLYVLTAPDYGIEPLPVEGFDPKTDGMTIIGDLFDWTLILSEDTGERIYAVDANDYTQVDTLSYPAAESLATRISRCLFPFEVRFTSYDDQFVRPRIRHVSAAALPLGILLAAVYLTLRRRRILKELWAAAGIVLLGLFLFIPLLVIRR